MGCWCGLASGIVIGRLINEWRSTWCILRARTAKTRSCYQGGRKSQPSILVSVAPQNVWPTQKKLRVWMVWNEGMWGRALVLGRAYIMKNLLTTTTIAARGKVNFSWPKWHRLSDRLNCVFSLCVLLESLMLELILKSDLETFLCQRADHPILIFKSRNSVSVFSVLAPAYFEEERTDNAFNSSEDD